MARNQSQILHANERELYYIISVTHKKLQECDTLFPLLILVLVPCTFVPKVSLIASSPSMPVNTLGSFNLQGEVIIGKETTIAKRQVQGSSNMILQLC